MMIQTECKAPDSPIVGHHCPFRLARLTCTVELPYTLVLGPIIISFINLWQHKDGISYSGGPGDYGAVIRERAIIEVICI